MKFKSDVEEFLANILHKKQPWYHGIIPREEADRRLEQPGNQNGTFLFRERGGGRNEYVLGILHEGKAFHYLFSTDSEGKLSIKTGKKFINLMQIVEYYSLKSDGLLCKLSTPCNIDSYQVRPSQGANSNILLDPDIQTELRRRVTLSEDTLKKLQRAKRPVSSAQSMPGLYMYTNINC